MITSDNLLYIEFSQAKRETIVSQDIIQQFDCGNRDMTEYLYSYADIDAASGRGVTYILVKKADIENKSISRIYAYTTLKAHSLSYYDEGAKYHTHDIDDNGNVLLSIPCVEIKMFAIDKALKKQIAFTIDPEHHYSTIFFNMLLEKLYYMSMTVIGFQIIFLRANDEGENLYRKSKFVDCTDYLQTYDIKADGCKPLFLSLTEVEEIIFA